MQVQVFRMMVLAEGTTTDRSLCRKTLFRIYDEELESIFISFYETRSRILRHDRRNEYNDGAQQSKRQV